MTATIEREQAWGQRWLAEVLRRDLTPLEAKIAAWTHRVYAGIYHLDGGRDWNRWLKTPNDLTHEITTMTDLGLPGGGWGNLPRWIEPARELGLHFRLRSAGPYRIAVRFWHDPKHVKGDRE